MSKKIRAVVLVLYLVVALHFIVSNAYRTLGYSYTLATNQNPPLTQIEIEQMTERLCHGDSLSFEVYLPPHQKGFPVSTNNPCGGGSTNFARAKVYNAGYFVTITLIFAIALKVYKTKTR